MSQPLVSKPVWAAFLASHRDERLEAAVTTVLPFGALVTVGPGIPGLLPRAAWSAEPRIGDTVAVRIVEVDERQRRLSFTAA